HWPPWTLSSTRRLGRRGLESVESPPVGPPSLPPSPRTRQHNSSYHTPPRRSLLSSQPHEVPLVVGQGRHPAVYRHNRTGEDNADAHLKRQVMGREVVVAVTKGRLDFGPWEQVFYGEFDGHRPKRVLVKVIGE